MMSGSGSVGAWTGFGGSDGFPLEPDPGGPDGGLSCAASEQQAVLIPANLVFRDAAGNIVGHDIEVQTRACIENIRAILEDAGSSLEKVFDVTVYLTDMQRDFEQFNQVYAEYFGQIQPTRTTVGVDSLPTPISVELKVIASA